MSHPLASQGKGNKQYQGMEDVTGSDPVEEKAHAATPETTESTTASVTIDDIFNQVENAPKGKKKVQLTVYIDEDVAKAFSRYAKPIGKGAKSETINKFLKAKFKM